MSWSLKADRDGFLFSIRDAALAHNARRIFGTYLSGQADAASDLASAELIFGELIANVARHAPGPVDVRIRWSRGHAILEVIDRGPGYELTPTLPDDDSESKRGLFIVNVLAESVTVDRRDANTVTTVVLPVWRKRPVATRMTG